MPAVSPIHRPRDLNDSLLWKILHKHFGESKAHYDEHCEKHGGFFRPLLDGIGKEYLKCGDLDETGKVLTESWRTRF